MVSIRRSVRLALVAALSIAFLASAHAQTGGVIAIKAARMFDGRTRTLIPNPVVIVDGKTIALADSTARIPEGAQVIDLGDATISPGFLDAHTHLIFDRSVGQTRKAKSESRK